MKNIKSIIIIKIALAIIFIVLAFISYRNISEKLGSVEYHSKTIASLDESRNKVMELAGAAVASSSAITLLPGDVGTPIAQELADMGKYFLIVLCAIYLEKFLLTIAGYAAFKYIIPIACLFALGFIISNERIFAKIAAKLFLFGMVIAFTIPFSVGIAKMIERNYSSSIEQTLDNAKNNTESVEESAKEAKEEGNILNRIIDNVSENINELLKKFENTLSSFIEAIAVLIVTSCLIPIGVFVFLLWFIKLVFSVDVDRLKLVDKLISSNKA